jgi:DNA processing protein
MNAEWIDRFFWLWLFKQEGIGSSKVLKFRKIYRQRKRTYATLCEFILRSEKIIIPKPLCIEEEIVDFDRYCKSRDIFYRSIWQNNYPYLLRQISDPPVFLFCKGNDELLNELSQRDCTAVVAVVGTRSITDYGRRIVADIASVLEPFDIVVVSGLAQGIDGEAHRTLFDRGGERAVAVLPGGPLNGFPRINAGLYKRLIDRGVVLSEYFPGVKIRPGMFASRNRIIAGLSKLTVVVEAPVKSGALITASLANQYDRDVGAVPGGVYSRTARGTNNLIKQGAYLISCGEDVLDIVKTYSSGLANKNSQSDPKDKADEQMRLYLPEKFLEKDLAIDDSRIRYLKEALTGGGLSIERFIEIVEREAAEVRAFLTRMEIKGILRLDNAGLVKLGRKCFEISNS